MGATKQAVMSPGRIVPVPGGTASPEGGYSQDEITIEGPVGSFVPTQARRQWLACSVAGRRVPDSDFTPSHRPQLLNRPARVCDASFLLRDAGRWCSCRVAARVAHEVARPLHVRQGRPGLQFALPGRAQEAAGSVAQPVIGELGERGKNRTAANTP
jgi:hypothetical protein